MARDHPINLDFISLSLNETIMPANVSQAGGVTTIIYQPAMPFAEKSVL